MAQQINHKPEALSGLLIPLQGKQLLLPNVSVAELVAWQPPVPLEQAPDWLLGQFRWREQTLPLVSFERCNGEQGDSSSGSAQERVVILNGIGGDARLPFIGLLVQGIPRSIRLSPRELVPLSGHQGTLEKMRVQASGEEAVIPDLDLLERLLLESGCID